MTLIGTNNTHEWSPTGFPSEALLLHVRAYVIAKGFCEPLMLACYTAMLNVAWLLKPTNSQACSLHLHWHAMRRARYGSRLSVHS